VWAVAFAAPSFYWAAGGRVGAGTIGPAIESLALARDPAFVTLLWVTGVLKLLAAVLALMLVVPGLRGPLPPRLVGSAGWTAAVVLLGYGIANLVQHLLMWTGPIPVPAGLGTAALRWHLALWDPVWIIGGVLFTLAAVEHSRSARAGTEAPVASA